MTLLLASALTSASSPLAARQQPIPFFNAPIELETDHVDLPPVEPRDAKADRELALKRAKVRKIRLKRAMKRSGYRALLDAPVHIRNACRALVNWIWFDRFVLVLILGNCVLLAMDVPGAQLSTSQQNVRPRARGLLLLLPPLHTMLTMYKHGHVPLLLLLLLQAMGTAELAFTIAFTVEALVKIIGLGLVAEPTSYFRSAWNILDFVIVVEGILSMSVVRTQTNINTTLWHTLTLHPTIPRSLHTPKHTV